MKTKNQIFRYISQCSFPKDDWQQVLDYCRLHFGGGNAHKSQHPLSGSTYQQFLDWIDKGVGVGDIVCYGHTLGIVGGYSPKVAYLSAYLSFDGRLIVEKMNVDTGKLRVAEVKDIEKFNQLMADNGLRFSVKSSTLIKAYIPADGDFVRVSKGKMIMPAIFRADDGQRYCFYVVASGKSIFENEIDNKDDVIILAPTKTENLRLLETLSVNGLEWSAKDKCLRKMSDKRVKKWGRYYYITDTLDIESDADTYTKAHDRRFKCGNYFPNFQEAFRVRERVINVIRKTTEERKI